MPRHDLLLRLSTLALLHLPGTQCSLRFGVRGGCLLPLQGPGRRPFRRLLVGRLDRDSPSRGCDSPAMLRDVALVAAARNRRAPPGLAADPGISHRVAQRSAIEELLGRVADDLRILSTGELVVWALLHIDAWLLLEQTLLDGHIARQASSLILDTHIDRRPFGTLERTLPCPGSLPVEVPGPRLALTDASLMLLSYLDDHVVVLAEPRRAVPN